MARRVCAFDYTVITEWAVAWVMDTCVFGGSNRVPERPKLLIWTV